MGEFEYVKRNFGFGCMRLPMNGDEVEFAEFCKMVDYFLAQGFNYFDTAHGYLSGKSETAIRECLVKRRPRESYILTDKLTGPYFDKEEDIRPFFQSQLEACGVEYFDFYLMHSQCKDVFEKFKSCRAYETAFELKAEGRVKHVGISFHDTAEVLDEILTEYPQTEVVQLQLNYVDLDDPEVQARKCYEVCRRHGKPVLVMEPVKGGSLATLSEEITAPLKAAHPDWSVASWAMRWVASLNNCRIILSGMSDEAQVADNLATFSGENRLSEADQQVIAQVREAIRARVFVGCTACRYCMPCPFGVDIPRNFRMMNQFAMYSNERNLMGSWKAMEEQERASACQKCGKCEKACPQHLPIREKLAEIAERMK